MTKLHFSIRIGSQIGGVVRKFNSELGGRLKTMGIIGIMENIVP
jgi:hypothetical protein